MLLLYMCCLKNSRRKRLLHLIFEPDLKRRSNSISAVMQRNKEVLPPKSVEKCELYGCV